MYTLKHETMYTLTHVHTQIHTHTHIHISMQTPHTYTHTCTNQKEVLKPADCSLTPSSNYSRLTNRKAVMAWGGGSVGTVLSQSARRPGFSPQHHVT